MSPICVAQSPMGMFRRTANTREAIRKEQMRLGLAVDGWPTPELPVKL